jgi:hypothetical protein
VNLESGKIVWVGVEGGLSSRSGTQVFIDHLLWGLAW